MKNAIQSKGAPAAIGTYSQAVKVGAEGGAFTVYLSGQIGLDPASGELVAGGAAAEAEQALRNLAAVLEAAGSGFDRVARTTIYLVDMADFASVNEVYGRALGAARPARATVGVASLPKGARVEIDAVGLA